MARSKLAYDFLRPVTADRPVDLAEWSFHGHAQRVYPPKSLPGPTFRTLLTGALFDEHTGVLSSFFLLIFP
jgi:hypothetical protein